MKFTVIKKNHKSYVKQSRKLEEGFHKPQRKLSYKINNHRITNLKQTD